MNEGAKRVESYFERARVREETGSGGTGTSSGSATVVTHAQTPKRKADDETIETDTQSEKRQTADAAMPRVQVGGSSGSGCAAVSPVPTAESRGTTRSTAGHEELRRRHGDQSVASEKKGKKSARSES